MADSQCSTRTLPESSTYNKPKAEILLCFYYFKTIPGIIKLIQLVICMICMACVAPGWTTGSYWFLFIVITSFVYTTLCCIWYLFNLKSAISLPIDCKFTEFILAAIIGVLYLILSIVQIQSSVTKPRPPNNYKPFYILAGVCGIFNFLLYIVGSIFLYRDWIDENPSGKVVCGNERKT